MKFCQNMPYMYILKVKKFLVCAYLRIDSIKENIEGDANLHHPPTPVIGLIHPSLISTPSLGYPKLFSSLYPPGKGKDLTTRHLYFGNFGANFFVLFVKKIHFLIHSL